MRHHGNDRFGDVPDLVKSKHKLKGENGISAIIRLAHVGLRAPIHTENNFIIIRNYMEYLNKYS